MRKSCSIGKSTFIHLDTRNLSLDTPNGTGPFPFDFEANDKILDFWFDQSQRTLRLFTTDGICALIDLETFKTVDMHTIEQTFIAASIYQKKTIAIDKDYHAKLYDSKGEVLEDYSNFEPQFRFCLYTSQLKVLADSTDLMILKAGHSEWKRSKYRDFFIKNLINVNRQIEFGLITSRYTRIYYKSSQRIFRNWASKTKCLIQCPCSRHFFAHLDSDGIMRVGDDSSDFIFQESDVSGICWEMGVLWARSLEGVWHGVVMSYNDQLYDLRTVMLSQLEPPIDLQGTGRIVRILEAFKERPAMSKDMMMFLPPISQNMTDGIIVDEAKYSLDAYIKKSEQINEILGKLELALKDSN
ncbi:hypothetical protein GPJ56_001612 [Histomonas meleagridis]|uniref:uncharacterized protein n=1 Tax=Histomonas meleagridis TaxID=135588 RepID=UPI003559A80D|nr:hypothetical protein GPJ56_001612 [Histomonas meleagridis]KAH0807118.1 hypothetical protein GO595_000294 [Histomonas meleagridis]